MAGGRLALVSGVNELFVVVHLNLQSFCIVNSLVFLCKQINKELSVNLSHPWDRLKAAVVLKGSANPSQPPSETYPQA